MPDAITCCAALGSAANAVSFAGFCSAVVSSAPPTAMIRLMSGLQSAFCSIRRAMFVSGPVATIVTLPGWALRRA